MIHTVMRASSLADPHGELVAQLDAVLLERMSRDPDLRHLADLVGRWLTSCAARSAAGFPSEACPTEPVPASDELMPAVAALSETPAASEFAAADAAAKLMELKPSPEPAAEPPDPDQLAELLSRFSKPSVSPIVSPPARVAAPTSGVQVRGRNISELEIYSRRMELKADACAWAVKRCDQISSGLIFAEIKDEYDRLRVRADTMQPCFLWMIHQDAASIPREDWLRLEGCYRACGETLKTIVEFPDAYRSQDDLLKLLGETQSAIRAGMTACGAVPRWIDGDQQDVFTWCRDEGDTRRVFNVFLSLDRLADPSLSGGMLARVRKIREDLQESARSEKQRHRGLNTIRYHVGQIEDADEGSDHHWNRIAEGIGQVLRSGAAASNPDLVEAIIPVADDVPESFLDRPGVRDVLRYVDQRLAADEVRQQQFQLTTRATTPEVLRVREALRGSRMVLIGGESRPHSRDLLEREFELAELDWQDSREHQSITAFEASVARLETRLVVLMIRWSSHSFEGVQEVCERNGKVFVRLPGGYNPSQVAHQIVAQASEQLGIPASAS